MTGLKKILMSQRPRIIAGATAITNGLLGWWKFDEGTGTTVVDSSGNGHTGTLINSPSWTAGKIGGSITLNGSNQYVECGELADNLSDMTVSCWAKTTDGAGANWKLLVSKITNGGNGAGWYLSLYAGIVQLLTQEAGGNSWVQRGSAYSPLHLYDNGIWHHIVMTYSGGFYSGTFQIYVDSQPITMANHDGGTAFTSISTTSTVKIGVDSDLSSYSYFLGSIDDVRIYNRALSAAEVLQIYNLQG